MVLRWLANSRESALGRDMDKPSFLNRLFRNYIVLLPWTQNLKFRDLMVMYQIHPLHLIVDQPDARGAALGAPLDAMPPGLIPVVGGPLKPLPIYYHHGIPFLRHAEHH